jgi:hypothetical protein
VVFLHQFLHIYGVMDTSSYVLTVTAPHAIYGQIHIFCCSSIESKFTSLLVQVFNYF